MRTSFHHQPEAQHPNFQLSTSWQADYPIFQDPKPTSCVQRGHDTSRGILRQVSAPVVGRSCIPGVVGWF
jgi:hypothetical protein